MLEVRRAASRGTFRSQDGRHSGAPRAITRGIHEAIRSVLRLVSEPDLAVVGALFGAKGVPGRDDRRGHGPGSRGRRPQYPGAFAPAAGGVAQHGGAVVSVVAGADADRAVDRRSRDAAGGSGRADAARLSARAIRGVGRRSHGARASFSPSPERSSSRASRLRAQIPRAEDGRDHGEHPRVEASGAHGEDPVRRGGAYESETPRDRPRAMGGVSLWNHRRAFLGASGARRAGSRASSPRGPNMDASGQRRADAIRCVDDRSLVLRRAGHAGQSRGRVAAPGAQRSGTAPALFRRRGLGGARRAVCSTPKLDVSASRRQLACLVRRRSRAAGPCAELRHRPAPPQGAGHGAPSTTTRR